VYRLFPGGKDVVIDAVAGRELTRFFTDLAAELELASGDLESLLVTGIAFTTRSIRAHEPLQFVLAHEPERQRAVRQARASHEIVEIACDQFAVTHHHAGAALAQRKQAGQVATLRVAVGQAQFVLQLFLQWTEQSTGHGAELLDGNAFEFIEQAHRVRTGHVCSAKRLHGHWAPRVSAGALDRFGPEHSGTIGAVHRSLRNL
jgi:hypothetical protein